MTLSLGCSPQQTIGGVKRGYTKESKPFGFAADEEQWRSEPPFGILGEIFGGVVTVIWLRKTEGGSQIPLTGNI